jgi:hypothetical protein
MRIRRSGRRRGIGIEGSGVIGRRARTKYLVSWMYWLCLEIVVPSALLCVSVSICHLILLQMNRGVASAQDERKPLGCIG